MTETDSSRNLELDGLRGVAILLVVSKHYGLAFPVTTESELGRFFNLFYPTVSGVDLFFVLSGFLLGGSLLDSLDTPRYYQAFYRKRYYRTFAPYYLFLGIAVATIVLQEATGFYIVPGLTLPFSTPWSVVAYGAFLQNFLMAYEGSLGPAGLEITWSLAVQEQFYLILPFLLRWTPRRWLVAAPLSLALLAPIARFLLVNFDPRGMNHFYDCLLFLRTDTLCAGVLTAILLRNSSAKAFLMRSRFYLVPLGAVLLVGFALLTLCGLGRGTRTMYVIGHSYLAVLYSCLVLIAVLCPVSFLCRFLRTGVILELGVISYGLFLYHQLVNGLVHGLLFGAAPRTSESCVATLNAILLTIVIAELSWHLIEKPLIRRGRSYPASSQAIASSPLVAPTPV